MSPEAPYDSVSRTMDVKELFDLAGKVALVTDGSRGLGLEIAQGLGEAGAAVAITARSAQWLESAAAELGACVRHGLDFPEARGG